MSYSVPLIIKLSPSFTLNSTLTSRFRTRGTHFEWDEPTVFLVKNGLSASYDLLSWKSSPFLSFDTVFSTRPFCLLHWWRPFIIKHRVWICDRMMISFPDRVDRVICRKTVVNHDCQNGSQWERERKYYVTDHQDWMQFMIRTRTAWSGTEGEILAVWVKTERGGERTELWQRENKEWVK